MAHSSSGLPGAQTFNQQFQQNADSPVEPNCDDKGVKRDKISGLHAVGRSGYLLDGDNAEKSGVFQANNQLITHQR